MTVFYLVNLKPCTMKKRMGIVPENLKREYMLNDDELGEPELVFRDLFEAYDLPGIRQRLRDMMDSALSDRDCDAQSYFFLFRHLERLADAAHLIGATAPQQRIAGSEAADDALQRSPDEKFYRSPRFDEIASARPLDALSRAFGACDVQALIEEIEKWKRCVMTCTLPHYAQADHREQCWTFCEQLMCLAESAHLYLCNGQAAEKKEMANFFSFFTFRYAQRELWDCFEAVVGDEREDTCIDKGRVATIYRCLLAVIIATYHLAEGPYPEDPLLAIFEKAG